MVDTDKFGERMTGPAGRALLEQCGLAGSIPQSAKILDNACGTAIITRMLHEMLPRDQMPQIVCADYSEAMLEAVKKDIENEGWSTTSTIQADAMNTKLPLDFFDFVVTSFAIMGRKLIYRKG